jgi:VIT1/CCC1 family predicted Fe2+/Mn2+ transporter
LAEVGLLGLAVFLAPFAFVAYRLWRMNTLLAQFLALGIVSCVVASCNGSINLIWGVWTLLGLGLALVYQHKGE